MATRWGTLVAGSEALEIILTNIFGPHYRVYDKKKKGGVRHWKKKILERSPHLFVSLFDWVCTWIWSFFFWFFGLIFYFPSLARALKHFFFVLCPTPLIFILCSLYDPFTGSRFFFWGAIKVRAPPSGHVVLVCFGGDYLHVLCRVVSSSFKIGAKRVPRSESVSGAHVRASDLFLR